MAENVKKLNLYTDEMANDWIDENDEPITTGAKNNLKVEENGKLTELGIELGSDYDDPKWEDVLDQLTIKESQLRWILTDRTRLDRLHRERMHQELVSQMQQYWHRHGIKIWHLIRDYRWDRKEQPLDMVVYMVHPLISIVLHLMVETMNIFQRIQYFLA